MAANGKDLLVVPCTAARLRSLSQDAELEEFQTVQDGGASPRLVSLALAALQEEGAGNPDADFANYLQGVTVEDKKPLMEGMLTKRGEGFFSKSQERWFVLFPESPNLSYYCHHNDGELELKGEINLEHVSTVHETFEMGTRRVAGDKGKGLPQFEVHTPDRVYYLQAPSVVEMNEWIGRINQVVKRLQQKRYIESMLEDMSSGNESTTTATTTTTTTMTMTTTAADGDKKGPGGGNGSDATTTGTNVALTKWEPGAVADNFGAEHGVPILNRETILRDVDLSLGHSAPPAIEYIFVEPYLNYSGKLLSVSANPYGHAAIRYTLPNGQRKMMNIVGLANHEMVRLIDPVEYFFGVDFDVDRTGNEQGGVYNRNFAAIRVQRVPPERILAMDAYFEDLATRSSMNKANYNFAVGPLMNLMSGNSYGNCAWWTSRGLQCAGLYPGGAMFPKAIWVWMYENLRCVQQERISNNVNTVYYKRISHAKRFYGLDADHGGWSRPFHWRSHYRYQNLERLCDVVVEVPDGSMTAVVRKQTVDTSPSSLPSEHVEERALFNTAFWRNIPLPAAFTSGGDTKSAEDNTGAPNTSYLVECGADHTRQMWYANPIGDLYTLVSRDVAPVRVPSESTSDAGQDVNDGAQYAQFLSSLAGAVKEQKDRSDAEGDLVWGKWDQGNADWYHVPSPPLPSEGWWYYQSLSCSPSGVLWVVYGGCIFILGESHTWTSLQGPGGDSGGSPLTCLSLLTDNMAYATTADGGVWVWRRRVGGESGNDGVGTWYKSAQAPKLKSLSCSRHDGEVWGVEEGGGVYRRITRYRRSKWVQVHGLKLESVRASSHNAEVFGVDEEGVLILITPRQAAGNTSSIAADQQRNTGTQSSSIPSSDQVPVQSVHMPSMHAASSNASQLGQAKPTTLCWNVLGNELPVRCVAVDGKGTPIGLTDKSIGRRMFRLSRHRLVVRSELSSRKVWDDTGTWAKPFQVGFWRLTPPPGFCILGDVAERSHLEIHSSEGIVVRELGMEEGDLPILMKPVGFKQLWSDHGTCGKYGNCTVWEAVAPSSMYGCVGDLAEPTHKPRPTPDATGLYRCIHKKFLSKSTPYTSGDEKNPFLWCDRGSRAKSGNCSIWLSEPTLNSVPCNTFLCSNDKKYAPPLEALKPFFALRSVVAPGSAVNYVDPTPSKPVSLS